MDLLNYGIIENIELESYKQNFHPKKENKELYGEVNTPFSLIDEMISIIPDDLFINPNLKWLDPACGSGYFMMCLYKKLMKSLAYKFKKETTRTKHIIENMLYIVEYNEENITTLREMFGKKANIINADFLSTDIHSFSLKTKQKFDIIIGNPPYNLQGFKKVPTNKDLNKKQDGITVWGDFVKHSISLLNKGGYLSFIIPSIWMRPDKFQLYNYFLQYKIHKIKTFSNTETNRMFKGQAQTPTCYFLLQNIDNDFSVSLFNKNDNKYYHYNYQLNQPIPLFCSSIIIKMKNAVDKYGSIDKYVFKTNLPRKNILISNKEDDIYKHKNIRSCILNGYNPELVIEYSNKPCVFENREKIVMAHKMYGFPYYDVSGVYGISNRDNYVLELGDIGDITTDRNNKTDMYKKLMYFLSTKLMLYLYESMRYRMKFIERNIFELIPDITKMNDITINNIEQINIENGEKIQDKFFNFYFNLTELEINEINNIVKKNYNWFI